MGAGRTELAMSVFGHSYGQKITGTVKINGKEVDMKSVKSSIDNKLAYVHEDRKTYGIGDDCFSWSPDDPTVDSTGTLSDPEAREIYENELYDKYTECSKLVPTEQTATVTNGEINLEITLDPNAVVFYEIVEI